MNLETVKALGRAYALGLAYSHGLAHRGMAADEARWITVHPGGKGPKANGKGNKKGRKALIDSETGEVLGGMGGKFNGRHISSAHKGGDPMSRENLKISRRRQVTIVLFKLQCSLILFFLLRSRSFLWLRLRLRI